MPTTEAATYLVIETFTSIQGEGVRIGVPSTFVRLAHCNLTCAWCLDEDSMVLMGDYSEKRLGDLEVGDTVIAADRDSGNQHWVKATVERVEHAQKGCIRLVSPKGDVTLTPDHKLWKADRSKWSEAQDLLGHEVRFIGRPTPLSDDYLQGYLAGASDGDGTFWTLNKGNGHYRRYRIATNDVDILERIAEALTAHHVDFYWGRHGRTGFSGRYEVCDAVFVTKSQQAERLEQLVLEDRVGSHDWRTGYLAGLFDTDGSTGGGNSLRWCQQKLRVRERLIRVLENHHVNFVEEPTAIRAVDVAPLSSFVLELSLACRRKTDTLVLREAKGRAVVESLEPAGIRNIVTVTTSAGSYVANGFLVKNCDTTYAWKKGEMAPPEKLDAEAVVARVEAPDVVFTGGEPLLHDLGPVLDRLEGRFVTVETNATLYRPDPRVGLWSLSPKLGSSGQVPKPDVIRQFLAHGPERVQLKFVVGDRADLEAVKALLGELPEVAAGRFPVILQPVGIPGEDRDGYCSRMRELVEAELLPDPFWQAYAWRFLPQFHKLLWQDKRGI